MRQITRDRAILNGAPCITGTRIPVEAIWKFWKASYCISDILAEYPSLHRSQVAAALAYIEGVSDAKDLMVDAALRVALQKIEA